MNFSPDSVMIISSNPDVLVNELNSQGISPTHIIDPQSYEGRILTAMSDQLESVIFGSQTMSVARPCPTTNISEHDPLPPTPSEDTQYYPETVEIPKLHDKDTFLIRLNELTDCMLSPSAESIKQVQH
jgi:hypothetical protein